MTRPTTDSIILRFILFALLLVLPATAFAHDHGSMSLPVAVKGRSAKAVEFRNDMRRVWEDHIVWTRNVILSFAHELPDKGAAVDRLLKNQADIGAKFQPFYGAASATALTNLLREHITIAAEILTAAKAGDSAAVGAAVARWQKNADDISAFLAKINPHQWPFATMAPMMREHLDLTLKEAVARLNGKFVDDIAAYEEVHSAILAMADMLSLGIIAQKPGCF